MKIISRHSKTSADKPENATAAPMFSDEQLWLDFTLGIQAAFEQLYYRYVNLLYD